MKSILGFLLLFVVSIFLSAKETPFTKGVNLTGWFQVSSPTEIHFKKYTKKDFENIKSLGADVIRLPINLHSMTSGAPNYELDPLFLSFLDQAVDWAEELNIHILLDNHTFDPAESTSPDIVNILIPVWKNMAQHFKNRSNLVYYEILNEPHGIDDSTWNDIQGQTINAIREIDQTHTIIVGPAGFNSYNNLKYMPEYEDDNLIYTFHFYDPFIFTHQGASWADPSLVSLGGVPFPYNSSTMPAVPPDLQNTWVANVIAGYSHSGTIGVVRQTIDIAVDFMNERNVPLFCGEFGVYIPNSPINDRVLWYSIVRNYFELKGISWTIWDYHGGFGIFDKTDFGLFEHDLNINLVNALGFNAPPQSEYEVKPDSTEFSMYSDYIENGIISSGYSNGVLNFYDTDAKEGSYSISWENPSRYNSIGFNFVSNKDLSYLKSKNYSVSFWIRGSNPLSKFEIRFLDTKESSDDHRWRMSYTIDNSTIEFDGSWKYVQIPLNEFTETGAWDNEWFNPQGLFDWSKIDIFEIVNEFGQINSTKLWFDEIKVFDPNASSIADNSVNETSYHLYNNYPNPFNPTTSIEYSVPNVVTRRGVSVQLKVYDMLGNEVATLVNEQKSAGNYEVKFNAVNLSSGVYFYKLKAGSFVDIKKMILLK